jgi:tetratricopeptide (TPR) repeat protein
MQLKRPLFVPGRRIEQVGKLAEQPFFTRRPAGAPASVSAGAAARRPLLSRMAENAGALFSLTLSVILVVALIALVFAFVRELRQDRVLLETFVAPKDLVEQGYTSAVIAEKMLDEIRLINSQSTSIRARRALESGDAVPDVQIAHGGLSMKAIVRYARRLFDLPDATIGGEIVRRGTALRMTLRTRDRSGTEVIEVVRSDGNVDALLEDAGRAIVRATDPYILATYFSTKESNAGSETFPETLAAIDYVLRHPRDNDEAWALNLRGNVRVEQGRYNEAVADYRAAVGRGSPFRGNLALGLMAAGRRDEAVAYTREQLARADVTPGSRVDFGQLLLNDGDLQGALAIAREMSADSQQRQIVWRGLALLVTTLAFSHREAEALDAIAKYERLQGIDPLALGMRAFTYARLNRPEIALDYATRLDALQPGSQPSLFVGGQALKAAGRYDEAAANFIRVLDRFPDQKCAWADLGDARLAQGKPDAAIVAYRRHEEVAPKYGFLCAAQADFGWGRALDALGKPDAAVTKFAAAAKRDPDNVELWRAWAAVLGKQGKANEAAAKLEEARKAEARLAVPLKLN